MGAYLVSRIRFVVAEQAVRQKNCRCHRGEIGQEVEGDLAALTGFGVRIADRIASLRLSLHYCNPPADQLF
jgi:hypothetical protein